MGTSPQPLSEFGQAAVALDEEMRRFESLARDLDKQTLESDRGLSHASELLAEITTCRERLEAGMRALAHTLDQARGRNENAEKAIALRTHVWQQRQAEANCLLARFKNLGDSVHVLNATVAELRRPTSNALTPEEQRDLQLRLNQATKPLATLVEEAKSLVQDARSANMKMLERNADNMRQTLQAACNRLNLIAERRNELLN